MTDKLLSPPHSPPARACPRRALGTSLLRSGRQELTAPCLAHHPPPPPSAQAPSALPEGPQLPAGPAPGGLGVRERGGVGGGKGGARRGQGGHTPACGHSISCQRGGCAPHSRQVWAAPCQQPKINKILSAPNLLKHIHLAVPGKERREGGRGGRVSTGPFPQAGGDLSFLPRVLSAPPRPGALGGRAPGARVGAPAGHTGPTPGLAL